MKEEKRAKAITFIIDSRLENVSLLGVAVRGICSHLSFGELDTYYMELCVVEAVNNIIKHAYSLEPGHTVEVEIFPADDSMIFEVRDTGRLMNIIKTERYASNFETETLCDLSESGLGLLLIHSLMDKVVYKRIDDKNILTLKKYVTKLQPEQSAVC